MRYEKLLGNEGSLVLGCVVSYGFVTALEV